MPTPFINPYNFVEFDNDPNRITRQREESVSGHNTYNGLSGRLTCRLETLSRLFVGSGSNRNQFNRINGLPAIQGSSLKGVIRSIAEAISSSCFTLMSEEYKYESKYTPSRPPCSSISNMTYEIVPKTDRNGNHLFKIRSEQRIWRYNIKFSHSSLLKSVFTKAECKLQNNKGLCISCRLFGSSTDDENAQSFAGKVTIGDAKITGFLNANNNGEIKICSERDINTHSGSTFDSVYKSQHMLSNPKPHHENFYVNITDKKIKGRKFYYHQDKDKLSDNGKDDDRIEVVKKGVIFQFTADFQNLTEKELGLLCLAIHLDGNCAHKIGQGKPIGLGSARITIEKIEEFNTVNRYKKIQGANVIQNPQAIINKINGWVNALKKDNTVSFYEPGWEDLKAILHYPPYNHSIEYPERSWFQNNGPTPLPSSQDVALGKNMLVK